jgi:oxygen-independent coproporphyrinogen-3 oxidase
MKGVGRIGLYIHIPFCRAKCTYCDFNSYAGLEGLFDDYTTALAQEIAQSAPAAGVKTLYIGGGTPTVLPPWHLAQILDTARGVMVLDGDAEISIEANPGTVGAETMRELRAMGVNRLSLGVQSFDDAELGLLGRIHTASEAIEAFHAARKAGYNNINLDLIYGLPGQPLASWQATLERALALQPDHLSLYALSVEENTPLAAAMARGDLPVPDPDLAADMYELAQSTLSAAAFVHYEISNWASEPGFRCRHNLTYWRNEPYLGMGAGAHSWAGGRRRANVAHPTNYVTRMRSHGSAIAEEETISSPLEMGETMIMGLRLLDEGVEYARFHERFGVDLRQQFTGELAELADLGLIETDMERAKLSERGRLLGNQVFFRFLPELPTTTRG